jgi:hypothetical protein
VTSKEERLFLANGPKIKMSQGDSILLNSKCVTSVISSQLLIGFWKSMNIGTSCVADINRKKRSTSTTKGGRWEGDRLYATTGIARSSGTAGIPA